METFSALLAFCAGNSPVPGEFPSQRPVTRSFGVSFDLCLNKRLSKQSWDWWSETPSSSLWRQCNDSTDSSLITLKLNFLMKLSSLNFHHLKLLKWQLSVRPVMKIPSKWHFRYGELHVTYAQTHSTPSSSFHHQYISSCLKIRPTEACIVGQLQGLKFTKPKVVYMTIYLLQTQNVVSKTTCDTTAQSCHYLAFSV